MAGPATDEGTIDVREETGRLDLVENSAENAPSTGESEGQTAWCRGSTFDETAHAAAAVALTAVAKRQERNGKP